MYRENGQREDEANSEAVVVDRILPRLHGIVLKAHRLVSAIFAQFFVAEEDHAHCNLLQPDEGAKEPGCLHRAERRKPEDVKKNEKNVFLEVTY